MEFIGKRTLSYSLALCLDSKWTSDEARKGAGVCLHRSVERHGSKLTFTLLDSILRHRALGMVGHVLYGDWPHEDAVAIREPVPHVVDNDGGNDGSDICSNDACL